MPRKTFHQVPKSGSECPVIEAKAQLRNDAMKFLYLEGRRQNRKLRFTSYRDVSLGALVIGCLSYVVEETAP